MDAITSRLAAFAALPRPTPAAGTAAYAAEREAAFAHDPRRRENFERFQAFRRDRVDVDFLPIKLDIENVSRCNLRCVMCQVSDWPKGQRAEDMRYEDFKALLEQQWALLEIKLQGMGEPLMQGRDYFRMIELARSSRIWLRTTTNASLLHLRDNYKSLIDADPNEVQVSIDGADKATYEGIRRGAVFDRVIANCARLNDYCEQQGVVRTKMWVVVQEANRHQLPALVDLAARLGFKSLCFSLTLTDWGQSLWRERNDQVSVEHQLTPELCHELIARGREQGVEVAYWTVTDKFHTDAPDRLCPWPFERLFVSSDMRMVPCCGIGTPDVADLGDARDLTAAWNGGVYREFRAAHLEGRIPDYCKPCYADE